MRGCSFVYRTTVMLSPNHIEALPSFFERGRQDRAARTALVVPLELAGRIVTLDHDVPRTELEQIIPYPMAREG